MQIDPANVEAIRPFLPASDLELSIRFYSELGFRVVRLADDIASVHAGRFSFLLQSFQADGFAENYMMSFLVHDLDSVWQQIVQLDLATRFGVRAPTAPAMQPWGLMVAFVVDPSGVLWHFAQIRKERPTNAR